jgi:uncharacterized protein YbaP (TraB family)
MAQSMDASASGIAARRRGGRRHRVNVSEVPRRGWRSTALLCAAALALMPTAGAPALAAGKAAALEHGAATAPYAQGLLWRVDRPGVPATYLFGTLHLDDERVTTLAPPVRRALTGARVLVVELVTDEAAVARFRSAQMTREPALRDALGPYYAEVSRALDAHDVPRAKQAHLTPWAALLTLLQPTERQRIILDHVLIMDAQAAGKPVRALETADEQIEAFAGLSREAQLALLRDAAARQADVQAAVVPLREAYLRRDLAAIERINAEAMGEDPSLAREREELLARVLHARNARFVERIVPYVERGGAFIAFGALHLYGPTGVLAQLAARGYPLKRVW